MQSTLNIFEIKTDFFFILVILCLLQSYKPALQHHRSCLRITAREQVIETMGRTPEFVAN